MRTQNTTTELCRSRSGSTRKWDGLSPVTLTVIITKSHFRLLRNLWNTSRPYSTTTPGTLPTLFSVGFLSQYEANHESRRLFPGEFLNFFLLGVQFKLTDTFLNNKFQWSEILAGPEQVETDRCLLRYGIEVVQYYSTPYRDRQNPEMAIRNNTARYNISTEHIFLIVFQ